MDKEREHACGPEEGLASVLILGFCILRAACDLFWILVEPENGIVPENPYVGRSDCMEADEDCVMREAGTESLESEKAYSKAGNQSSKRKKRKAEIQRPSFTSSLLVLYQDRAITHQAVV